MLDLNAIRKRAEAATEGNWHATLDDPYERTHVIGAFNGGGPAVIGDVKGDADATFIAKARQDVPALIAEVERLRTQQARLIAELEKADKFSDELRAELFRQQLPGIRKIVEDYVKEETE